MIITAQINEALLCSRYVLGNSYVEVSLTPSDVQTQVSKQWVHFRITPGNEFSSSRQEQFLSLSLTFILLTFLKIIVHLAECASKWFYEAPS